MNKDEIQAKYKTLHDALGCRKDAPDKELFDQQHAAIWHHCDLDLQARKQVLKLMPSLSQDEATELAALTTILPDPTPPDPDYNRVSQLLGTSPAVITQPEIWELLRIFGRKLGYR